MPKTWCEWTSCIITQPFREEKDETHRELHNKTDALGQLFRRKPAIGLDDVAFAMHPLRLNEIKPRALRRKPERQETYLYLQKRCVTIRLSSGFSDGQWLCCRDSGQMLMFEGKSCSHFGSGSFLVKDDLIHAAPSFL